MTKCQKSVLCLLCFLLQSFVASQAFAQATRTWVSGVGDDANPCSRTAPCKTFAGAIAKTAAGGEIDALDPGGFGAVTITKAITIDGGGGQVASILVAGTDGIDIQAGPNDVVAIRNLRINGTGSGINGIRFVSGGALHIESVEISGFMQYGVEFDPTSSPSAGLGAGLFMHDVTVTDSGSGVVIEPVGVSAVASLDDVRLDQNTYGLWVGDNAVANVRRSRAAANVSGGFIAQTLGSGPAAINLEDSKATDNSGTGIVAANQGASVSLSSVDIVHNVMGINARNGGTVYSFGNNRIFLNGSPGSRPAIVQQQ
jgi:hypothetical protein